MFSEQLLQSLRGIGGSNRTLVEKNLLLARKKLLQPDRPEMSHLQFQAWQMKLWLRRKNILKESSNQPPLCDLLHFTLLPVVPIKWLLDQAMNLSSHFMLKPQSSSANPCNEEEVWLFMLPWYSLAENILPSGTKSEDLKHWEEFGGEGAGNSTKTLLVSLGWTAWVHCYPDDQGNVDT